MIPNFKTMLNQLVACPSVSSTSEQWDMGNIKVVEQLAHWLEPLGFDCRIEMLPGCDHKANLIATLGSGPGGLVLAGHTDTVPFDESLWDSNPLAISDRDNRFYGLGSTDMKGFFPVVLEAVKDFVHTPLQQPLIILATADEESSMNGARALAEQGFPKARYAVIGEPTGLVPIRMHKGIMMQSVHVQGQSGHSSNPHLGNNALETMHGVLGTLIDFQQALRRDYDNAHFDVHFPTMNLGCIHGGDNPNRICGECEVHFDLRALPGMDNQGLIDDIHGQLQQWANQSGCDVTMKPLIQGVDPFAESEQSRLVQLAEKLTGHQADAVNFATEAPFLQQLGMETIVLGPGSIDQAHQANEYLAHDQIEPAIAIIRRLIAQFCL